MRFVKFSLAAILWVAIAPAAQAEPDFSSLQLHTLVFTLNGEEVHGISNANMFGGMFAQAQQTVALEEGRLYPFKVELESPDGKRRDITRDADTIYEPMSPRVRVDGAQARLAILPAGNAPPSKASAEETGLIVQYEKISRDSGEDIAGAAGSVYVHFDVTGAKPRKKISVDTEGELN